MKFTVNSKPSNHVEIALLLRASCHANSRFHLGNEMNSAEAEQAQNVKDTALSGQRFGTKLV